MSNIKSNGNQSNITFGNMSILKREVKKNLLRHFCLLFIFQCAAKINSEQKSATDIEDLIVEIDKMHGLLLFCCLHF